jgi:hypothetical protein
MSTALNFKNEEAPYSLPYHGETYFLYPFNKEGKTIISIIALTSLGNRLAPISGSVKNEEYREESMEAIFKQGLYVSDKPPRTP